MSLSEELERLNKMDDHELKLEQLKDMYVDDSWARDDGMTDSNEKFSNEFEEILNEVRARALEEAANEMPRAVIQNFAVKGWLRARIRSGRL